jgi:hypothetical protein
MKMPTPWATITTVSAAAFATGAAAEQKFQKLTGAQIEARFVGMELTDESHWGETFGRNGTLAITSTQDDRPLATSTNRRKASMISELVECFASGVDLEGEREWKVFQHCLSCA